MSVLLVRPLTQYIGTVADTQVLFSASVYQLTLAAPSSDPLSQRSGNQITLNKPGEWEITAYLRAGSGGSLAQQVTLEIHKDGVSWQSDTALSGNNGDIGGPVINVTYNATGTEVLTFWVKGSVGTQGINNSLIKATFVPNSTNRGYP